MEYGNSVNERIKNFEAMHGASVYRGAWIYFEDGARREVHPTGALCEPSANLRERHQNIVQFYQIRLDLKVQEFDALKKLLQENPGAHSYWDENIARLEGLQKEAKDFQRALNDSQAELKKHMPGYLPPEEQAKVDEGLRRAAEAEANYRTALEAIQI